MNLFIDKIPMNEATNNASLNCVISSSYKEIVLLKYNKLVISLCVLKVLFNCLELLVYYY